MIDQVKKTIQRYKMFEPMERVVVAVSGGPDSMALLYVLNELNLEQCLDICVAHLDHHLRKDSSADLDFVKKTAHRLGFPFYARTLKKSPVRRGRSVEDVLRRLRYDFLLSVCKKFRADKIAVGHTKDDQAETVLMRILRGSGLYGLAAVLPKRALAGREVVRPLIEVPRSRILDYLKKNRIPYRIDKTNLEDKFFRNKIRNALLPFLEKRYNRGIKDILSNLALTVGADYGYLQGLSRGFFDKHVFFKKNRCSVRVDALKHLDISLRRLVLRACVENLKGDLRRLSFKHWQEVEDLIFSRPERAQVHLPGGVLAIKGRKTLDFLKR